MIPVGLGCCQRSDVPEVQQRRVSKIRLIQVFPQSVCVKDFTAAHMSPHPLLSTPARARWWAGGWGAFVQQQVHGAITHGALQHDIIKPLKMNCNIDPLQAYLP